VKIQTQPKLLKEGCYADAAFQTTPSPHLIPFPKFLGGSPGSVSLAHPVNPPPIVCGVGGGKVYDGMLVDVDHNSSKSLRTAEMLAQNTLLAILRRDKSVEAPVRVPNEAPTLVRSKSDHIPIVQSLFAMKLETNEKNLPAVMARSASNVDSVRMVVQSPSVDTVVANPTPKELARLVLFDMEGTLGCMTKNRFRPRPGIREIATLKAKGYRVGLYTNKSARKLPRTEIEAAAGITFDVIYTGDDCKQATPSYCQLHGIDKYSRIKSLAKAGKLEDLLLVDDTPGKVEPQERHRVVSITTWDPNSKEDSELKSVVQSILANWNDRVFPELQKSTPPPAESTPVLNIIPAEAAADVSTRKRAESTGSQKSGASGTPCATFTALMNAAAAAAADASTRKRAESTGSQNGTSGATLSLPTTAATTPKTGENLPPFLPPSRVSSNPKPPRVSSAPPTPSKAEVIITKDVKSDPVSAPLARSGSRSGSFESISSNENGSRSRASSLVERVLESKAINNKVVEEKPVLFLRSNYGVTTVALG